MEFPLNIVDKWLNINIDTITIRIEKSVMKVEVQDAWKILIQCYPLLSSKFNQNSYVQKAPEQNHAIEVQFSQNSLEQFHNEIQELALSQVCFGNNSDTDYARLFYSQAKGFVFLVFSINHSKGDLVTQILLFNELLRILAGKETINYKFADLTEWSDFKCGASGSAQKDSTIAHFKKQLAVSPAGSNFVIMRALTQRQFDKLLQNKDRLCSQALLTAADLVARREVFGVQEEGRILLNCAISRRNAVNDEAALGNVFEPLYYEVNESLTSDVFALAKAVHRDLKFALKDKNAFDISRNFIAGNSASLPNPTSYISNLGSHLVLGIGELPVLETMITVQERKLNARDFPCFVSYSFSRGFSINFVYSGEHDRQICTKCADRCMELLLEFV